MSSLSVAETAAILGVSDRRIRSMIADGLLAAERVGGRWILTDTEVARLKALRRQPGRPYSPAHAWGLLAIAGGRTPSWLSGTEQRRLTAVLADTSVEDLSPALRRRADHHEWYVHPGLVPDLVADERCVVGGHGATRKLRHAGPLPLYTSATDLDALSEEYQPTLDAANPNLTMLTIHSAWPFRSGERVVWDVVAAVDLLGYANDDRALRVAHELLEAAHA
ncbi:MAG: helix-turn-helix domain-containing protein [Actinomycetota bacterium]|nr:helix-turn-helix domain-containing protein [Actinomycetota bacterium]